MSTSPQRNGPGSPSTPPALFNMRLPNSKAQQQESKGKSPLMSMNTAELLDYTPPHHHHQQQQQTPLRSPHCASVSPPQKAEHFRLVQLLKEGFESDLIMVIDVLRAVIDLSRNAQRRRKAPVYPQAMSSANDLQTMPSIPELGGTRGPEGYMPPDKNSDHSSSSVHGLPADDDDDEDAVVDEREWGRAGLYSVLLGGIIQTAANISSLDREHQRTLVRIVELSSLAILTLSSVFHPIVAKLVIELCCEYIANDESIVCVHPWILLFMTSLTLDIRVDDKEWMIYRERFLTRQRRLRRRTESSESISGSAQPIATVTGGGGGGDPTSVRITQSHVTLLTGHSSNNTGVEEPSSTQDAASSVDAVFESLKLPSVVVHENRQLVARFLVEYVSKELFVQAAANENAATPPTNSAAAAAAGGVGKTTAAANNSSVAGTVRTLQNSVGSARGSGGGVSNLSAFNNNPGEKSPVIERLSSLALFRDAARANSSGAAASSSSASPTKSSIAALNSRHSALLVPRIDIPRMYRKNGGGGAAGSGGGVESSAETSAFSSALRARQQRTSMDVNGPRVADSLLRQFGLLDHMKSRWAGRSSSSSPFGRSSNGAKKMRHNIFGDEILPEDSTHIRELFTCGHKLGQLYGTIDAKTLLRFKKDYEALAAAHSQDIKQQQGGGQGQLSPKRPSGGARSMSPTLVATAAGGFVEDNNYGCEGGAVSDAGLGDLAEGTAGGFSGVFVPSDTVGIDAYSVEAVGSCFCDLATVVSRFFARKNSGVGQHRTSNSTLNDSGFIAPPTLIAGATLPPSRAMLAAAAAAAAALTADGAATGEAAAAAPTNTTTNNSAVEADYCMLSMQCALHLLRELDVEAKHSTPIILGCQLFNAIDTRNAVYLDALCHTIATLSIEHESILFTLFGDPTSLVGYPTGGRASESVPRSGFLDVWVSVVRALLEITPLPYDALCWSLASLCYVMKRVPMSCSLIVQCASVCATVLHEVLELLRKDASFHPSFAICLHYTLELFDLFLTVDKPSETLIAVLVSLFVSSNNNPIGTFIKTYAMRVLAVDNPWELFGFSSTPSPEDDPRETTDSLVRSQQCDCSLASQCAGSTPPPLPHQASHQSAVLGGYQSVLDTLFWPHQFSMAKHRVRVLNHYRSVARFAAKRHHGGFLSLAQEIHNGEHPVDFILDPVEGIALLILSDIAPPSWFAMKLEVLRLVEELSLQAPVVSPLLVHSSWVATYTRYMYLAFLESYHSEAFAQKVETTTAHCTGLLRALSALCHQDVVARRWALKLGVVRTLVHEIDLEQSITEDRERQLRKASSAALLQTNSLSSSRHPSMNHNTAADEPLSPTTHHHSNNTTGRRSPSYDGPLLPSTDLVAAHAGLVVGMLHTPGRLHRSTSPTSNTDSARSNNNAVSATVDSSGVSMLPHATVNHQGPHDTNINNIEGRVSVSPSAASGRLSVGSSNLNTARSNLNEAVIGSSPPSEAALAAAAPPQALLPIVISSSSPLTQMSSPLTQMSSPYLSQLPSPPPQVPPPRLPFSIPKLSLANAPPPLYYTGNGDTANFVEACQSNMSFVKSGSFAFPTVDMLSAPPRHGDASTSREDGTSATHGDDSRTPTPPTGEGSGFLCHPDAEPAGFEDYPAFPSPRREESKEGNNDDGSDGDDQHEEEEEAAHQAEVAETHNDADEDEEDEEEGPREDTQADTAPIPTATAGDTTAAGPLHEQESSSSAHYSHSGIPSPPSILVQSRPTPLMERVPSQKGFAGLRQPSSVLSVGDLDSPLEGGGQFSDAAVGADDVADLHVVSSGSQAPPLSEQPPSSSVPTRSSYQNLRPHPLALPASLAGNHHPLHSPNNDSGYRSGGEMSAASTVGGGGGTNTTTDTSNSPFNGLVAYTANNSTSVVYIPPLVMTTAALRQAQLYHNNNNNNGGGSGSAHNTNNMRSPSARANRTVRVLEPNALPATVLELESPHQREPSPDAKRPDVEGMDGAVDSSPRSNAGGVVNNDEPAVARNTSASLGASHTSKRSDAGSTLGVAGGGLYPMHLLMNEAKYASHQRSIRRVYLNRTVQAEILHLILSLIVCPQGTLEPWYSSSYTAGSGRKVNALFYLHMHLNHDANAAAVRQLWERIVQIPSGGATHHRRGLVLLLQLIEFRTGLASMYDRQEKVGTGGYGVVTAAVVTEDPVIQPLYQALQAANGAAAGGGAHGGGMPSMSSIAHGGQTPFSPASATPAAGSRGHQQSATVGERVAIKTASVPHHIDNRETLVSFFNEVAILSHVQDIDGTALVLDCGCDGSQYMIVMPLYRCSLRDWRKSVAPTGIMLEQEYLFSQAVSLFSSILRVLCEVHQRRIVHHDMKLDNVFLDVPFGGWDHEDASLRMNHVPVSIRLGDWGESELVPSPEDDHHRNQYSADHGHPLGSHLIAGSADFSDSMMQQHHPHHQEGHPGGRAEAQRLLSRMRGTECIRPPEALVPHRFIKEYPDSAFHDPLLMLQKQDVWGVGCLLYELMTGDILFSEEDFGKMVHRILSDNGELLDTEHKAALRNVCRQQSNVSTNSPTKSAWETRVALTIGDALEEFITRVLCRDPKQRMTLIDVRQSWEELIVKMGWHPQQPTMERQTPVLQSPTSTANRRRRWTSTANQSTTAQMTSARRKMPWTVLLDPMSLRMVLDGVFEAPLADTLLLGGSYALGTSHYAAGGGTNNNTTNTTHATGVGAGVGATTSVRPMILTACLAVAPSTAVVTVGSCYQWGVTHLVTYKAMPAAKRHLHHADCEGILRRLMEAGNLDDLIRGSPRGVEGGAGARDEDLSVSIVQPAPSSGSFEIFERHAPGNMSRSSSMSMISSDQYSSPVGGGAAASALLFPVPLIQLGRFVTNDVVIMYQDATMKHGMLLIPSLVVEDVDLGVVISLVTLSVTFRIPLLLALFHVRQYYPLDSNRINPLRCIQLARLLVAASVVPLPSDKATVVTLPSVYASPSKFSPAQPSIIAEPSSLPGVESVTTLTLAVGADGRPLIQPPPQPQPSSSTFSLAKMKERSSTSLTTVTTTSPTTTFTTGTLKFCHVDEDILYATLADGGHQRRRDEVMRGGVTTLHRHVFPMFVTPAAGKAWYRCCCGLCVYEADVPEVVNTGESGTLSCPPNAPHIERFPVHSWASARVRAAKHCAEGTAGTGSETPTPAYQSLANSITNGTPSSSSPFIKSFATRSVISQNLRMFYVRLAALYGTSVAHAVFGVATYTTPSSSAPVSAAASDRRIGYWKDRRLREGVGVVSHCQRCQAPTHVALHGVAEQTVTLAWVGLQWGRAPVANRHALGGLSMTSPTMSECFDGVNVTVAAGSSASGVSDAELDYRKAKSWLMRHHLQ